MSGMVGILNLDGRPVDKVLLKAMTAFLSFRGPDATDIWVNGSVGFGHTLLRTTFESEGEHQPFTLDGRVWITADARIDARDDLKRKLEAKGCPTLKEPTDVELILRAHHVWGDDVVDHLLGDFAFAIWDAARHRFFCARDHFGMKPFFYTHVGKSLLFSNTLNCLRMHPAVSDEINEMAIVDFLIFGLNRRLGCTAFEDIQRLPPASALAWSPGETPRCRCYWKLTPPKPIQFRKAGDCVERFRELLRESVRDRLRAKLICVSMSGGLDSTSVAVTAHEVLSADKINFDMRAFTMVFDRLVPDDERYFSRMVAGALDIPIYHIPLDDHLLTEDWNQIGFNPAEPAGIPMAKPHDEYIPHATKGFRVALTGQGGDPVLHPSPAKFRNLLKGLVLSSLILDIVRYTWSRKRLPVMGVRTSVRRRLGQWKRSRRPLLPGWLDEDLKARLKLALHHEEGNGDVASFDCVRSEAYVQLAAPFWVSLFESLDPGVTGQTVEIRHPFFDLRLMNFLLALPPVPWCVDKEILRAAMLDRLPKPVRTRPKTPLRCFPVYEQIARSGLPGLNKLASTKGLARFVNKERFLKMARNPKRLLPGEEEIITRPLGLAIWLRQVEKSKPVTGGN